MKRIKDSDSDSKYKCKKKKSFHYCLIFAERLLNNFELFSQTMELLSQDFIYHDHNNVKCLLNLDKHNAPRYSDCKAEAYCKKREM